MYTDFSPKLPPMNYRCALLTILFCASFCVTSQTRPKQSPVSRAKADDAQLYRNTTFGFRFKVPFGWVDRTKEMRAQESAGTANSAKSSDAPTETSGTGQDAEKKYASAIPGELLLAVFERPPEATGETVNSAVVIAAESAASYPGVNAAEDYIEPLTELATAKGFKASGDPSTGEIDGRELVRAGFRKTLSDKVTMRQTTLVLLAKGQIVSFTFIAGTEDEVKDLIDGLSFDRAKSAQASHAK
jgi:hypothetical protein